MRQAFQDPALQATFEREGYVVIPLLDREQVSALKQAAVRVLPDHPALNDPQGSAYVSYFDVERREPVSRLIQSFVTKRLADVLVGYQPLYSTFFYKHANAAAMDLHQHSPCVADPAETVIDCWCPLVDCNAQTGSLQVVPRAHQLFDHVQTPQTPLYWSAFDATLRAKHMKTLSVKAGEAVLFEDSLPHGSSANLQSKSRLATLTTMIPAEAIPAFHSRKGSDTAGYLASDSFAYSDFFNDRLPPQSEWQKVVSHGGARTPADLKEFERRMTLRNAPQSSTNSNRWADYLSQKVMGRPR